MCSSLQDVANMEELLLWYRSVFFFGDRVGPFHKVDRGAMLYKRVLYESNHQT